MISSYFDLRARRMDRLENEANAERRHREILEERREDRRREEERRRDERAQEEERRRDERAQEEERRREDERRHRELMMLLATTLANGRNQSGSQSEIISTLQQTIADLQAENARLRQENGNGSGDTASSPL